MNANDSTNKPINVSEDRMRGVIAEFELRFRDWLETKLEHKADLAMLNVARRDIDSQGVRLTDLETWRTQQETRAGVLAGISAKRLALWGLGITAFVGLLSVVATLVWLAVS